MKNNIKEIQGFVQEKIQQCVNYSHDPDEGSPGIHVVAGYDCYNLDDPQPIPNLPITLARVLNALRKSYPLFSSFNYDKTIRPTGLSNHLPLWDLSKDFQDQSELTQIAIAKLLGWEGKDE